MRKKKEIIIYKNLSLFYDFCTDCIEELSYNKYLRTPIFFMLLVDCIYLFIMTLLILFKINIYIITLISFFSIIFINIIIYYIFSIFLKRKLRDYLLALYPTFLKLLSTRKYSALNSLTMLNELAYYVQKIKNQSQNKIEDIHPKIYAIITFLLSAIFSWITSLTLLFILIAIFIFLLILKDLFDIIFSKNYNEFANSILLSCIEERRLEIIKSSQRNGFTKLKYALRLGEYH